MNTKKTSPYTVLATYAEDLTLMPFGPRTEKSYWACVRQFSEHLGKSPDLGTPEDLRQYFIHLKTKKKLNRVRALLRQLPLLSDAEEQAWQLPTDPSPVHELEEPVPTRPILCRCCRKPMRLVARWNPGQPQPQLPERSPP